MSIYEMLKQKNRAGRQDKRFPNKGERAKMARVRKSALSRRERGK